MTLNTERASQVSDRRRRLIAVDEENATSDLLAEYGIIAHPAAVSTAPIHQSGDRIVRRLISRKLWKHTLLIGVMTAIAAAAVAAACVRSQLPTALPIDQITRTIAGLELLLAGQFSILIAWLRSRSQVDYRGRYRSWRWFGVVLIGAACVTLTELQPALTGLLADSMEPLIGSIRAARPALTVVPGSALLVLLLSRVVPDSGRNRISQLMLLFAGVPTLLYLFEVSESGMRLLPQVETQHLRVAASHLIFSAVLLHARFVAWICNDPPLPSASPATPAAGAAETASAADLDAADEGTLTVSQEESAPAEEQTQRQNPAESDSPQTQETSAEEDQPPAEESEPGPAVRKTKTRSPRRKKKYRKAG